MDVISPINCPMRSYHQKGFTLKIAGHFNTEIRSHTLVDPIYLVISLAETASIRVGERLIEFPFEPCQEFSNQTMFRVPSRKSMEKNLFRNGERRSIRILVFPIPLLVYYVLLHCNMMQFKTFYEQLFSTIFSN